MSKQQIASLPTATLRAIINSTNPMGRFVLELAWAREELARRNRWDGRSF